MPSAKSARHRILATVFYYIRFKIWRGEFENSGLHGSLVQWNLLDAQKSQ